MFKEIKEIYRFLKKTPSNSKDIVFYSEHDGYYPNFEGVINYLTKDKDLQISYITSSAKDPILNTDNKNINPFYINKLFSLFMRLVDSKVFVMTLADLDQAYVKRSLNSVHYVYIFHALVSTHMMYRYGALDHYDSILCVGPHQIREIRKQEELYDLKPKKLVEAGYYRLERIYEAYKNRQQENSKKTILIAPSWGKDNILESCGLELIAALLKNDYKVIVRPHPESIKTAPDLIKKIEREFSSDDDFRIEKSIASDESMLEADVLICDCSGISLEYAFGTERPVLFIDVPVKIKNDKFRELEIEPLELQLRPKIGKLISVDKVPEVSKYVQELIESKDEYGNKLIELRSKLFYNFGNSSEVSGDYIVGLLR